MPKPLRLRVRCHRLCDKQRPINSLWLQNECLSKLDQNRVGAATVTNGMQQMLKLDTPAHNIGYGLALAITPVPPTASVSC